VLLPARELHNVQGDSMDDDLLALGLKFYLDNEESIIKLCRKMVRRAPRERRQQCFELAIDEAIRTIPMAMNTYRSNGGATLRTHVLGNVRWYIWKAIVADLKETSEQLDRNCKVQDDAFRELILRDEVESLLALLPNEYAEILRWRFIDEMSLAEIAQLLDCATSGAHGFVQAATNHARELARTRKLVGT
jgi:DNA-directed RNA polymerase specialized sigma24 family protein